MLIALTYSSLSSVMIGVFRFFGPVLHFLIQEFCSSVPYLTFLCKNLQQELNAVLSLIVLCFAFYEAVNFPTNMEYDEQSRLTVLVESLSLPEANSL